MHFKEYKKQYAKSGHESDPLVHLWFPGSLLSCHPASVAQALLLRSWGWTLLWSKANSQGQGMSCNGASRMSSYCAFPLPEPAFCSSLSLTPPSSLSANPAGSLIKRDPTHNHLISRSHRSASFTTKQPPHLSLLPTFLLSTPHNNQKHFS